MIAAEAMAVVLKDSGIERVYCFGGGTISLLLDRIQAAGIQVVVCRNEAGAGHAAQGAYRVSGKPQVVVVTSGPGVTNALTPIADSFYDSDAAVFLCGQVATSQLRPSSELRQRGFQETPTVDLASPISKAAWQAHEAEDCGEMLRDALETAMVGRPGPVVIDLPMDLLAAEI
jgi:acetolactate synthase-1/2/3 large subunit